MTTETTHPLTDWVNNGWNDHAEDAQGVMDRFGDAIALMTEPAHLAPLATLIVHVAANHLGAHAEGLELLDRLSAHGLYSSDDVASLSVVRCRAILHTCSGNAGEAERYAEAGHPPGDLPRASTSIRIQATAAGAMMQQGDYEPARRLYLATVQLADYGPTNEDPAARALAIASNNIACQLEGRSDRTPDQDDWLELAAKTARIYWAVAGTWVQVKIAEYRLAMTYIALGNGPQAIAHAQLSLALCDENDGAPTDRFFPYEALARAQHLAGDGAAAKEARNCAAAILEGADEDHREWFTESLTALDAAL